VRTIEKANTYRIFLRVIIFVSMSCCGREKIRGVPVYLRLAAGIEPALPVLTGLGCYPVSSGDQTLSSRKHKRTA
jgi:hypothetical protein